MTTKQGRSSIKGSVDSASTEDQNIGLVRRGYDAFASGNMTILIELFQADATWCVPAMGIFAGNYAGRDAILEFFAQTQKEADGTFRAIPGIIAATGDRVFVQQQMSGKRQGRVLDTSAVVVFTIANGRVREVNEYYADYPASAAFWG